MTSVICAANTAENATMLGMGIGAAIFVMFGLFFLAVLLGGLFMSIGARTAHVKNVTFGKAVLASFFAGFGGNLVAGIFIIIPFVGPVVAFFTNIITQVYIIKAIFDTETGKAFLTWLFNLIAQVIVVIIAAIIFWGSIAAWLAANMPQPN
jgi:hypothetical protein